MINANLTFKMIAFLKLKIKKKFKKFQTNWKRILSILSVYCTIQKKAITMKN